MSYPIIQVSDLWAAIQTHEKTQYIKEPNHKISFEYMFIVQASPGGQAINKILQNIKTNPYLREKINEPCQNLYKDMIKEMSDILIKYDERFRNTLYDYIGKMIFSDMWVWKINSLESEWKQCADKFKAKMDQTVYNGWNQYCTDNAELKNFIGKLRTKWGLRLAGVSLNAVTLGMSLNPISLTMATFGIFKGIAQTVYEYKTIYENVSGAVIKIEQDIKNLNLRLIDKSVTSKFSETTRTVASAICGVDILGKTGVQLEKDLEFFKINLLKSIPKLDKLSKQLDSALKSNDESLKMITFDEVNSKNLSNQHATNATNKSLDKIEKEIKDQDAKIRKTKLSLEQNEKSCDTMIKSIISLHEKTQLLLKEHETFSKNLKDIMTDSGNSGQKAFKKNVESVADVLKFILSAGITSWGIMDKYTNENLVALDVISKASKLAAGGAVKYAKYGERHHNIVSKLLNSKKIRKINHSKMKGVPPAPPHS